MTSIEQAAHTHAQEWNNHAEDQFNRGVESATGVDEDSFAAGVSWLAEYLLSDESVHTAAVAIDPAAWEPGIFYFSGSASVARDYSLDQALAVLSAVLDGANHFMPQRPGSGDPS